MNSNISEVLPLSLGLYLIYTDGTIIEYLVTKNSSLSKVNEFKVPYDNCGYAALVDKLGNLLITGGKGTPMMKMHPKTKGLKKLTSKIPLNFFDLKALRVFVGPYLKNFLSRIMETSQ